jgi:cytochrome b subunit of formate dehydrogenase
MTKEISGWSLKKLNQHRNLLRICIFIVLISVLVMFLSGIYLAIVAQMYFFLINTGIFGIVLISMKVKLHRIEKQLVLRQF